MPWNDNKGGKSPWGDGPTGSGNDEKSPWGRPGEGGQQGPDLEDSLRKMQEKFANRRKGGGKGGSGGGKGGSGGLSGAGFAMFAVIGAIGWLATGVFQVNEQESAVVLRFGEYHSTRTPGFQVRFPDPIESHMIVPVNKIQSIEVGTGSTGQMLTGDANIVDIDFKVFWRISNPQDFLFNVKRPQEMLMNVSESAMREVVGKRDLVPIISSGRDEVQSSALQLIQDTLNSYGAGIQITEVNIAKSDPPAEVIDAFRDVRNAGQDKETTINQAKAYANNVVPRARGEAQKINQEAEAYRSKVISIANGEAERFRLVYEEYRKAPRVTRERMYLETMEEVLGRSDTILLDNSSGAVPYLPLDQLRRGGAK